MKIPTDDGSSLSHNPFAGPNLEGSPPRFKIHRTSPGSVRSLPA